MANPVAMMLAIVYAFMNLPPPLSMTECAMVNAIVRSIIFQEPASWAGVVRGAAQITKINPSKWTNH